MTEREKRAKLSFFYGESNEELFKGERREEENVTQSTRVSKIVIGNLLYNSLTRWKKEMSPKRQRFERRANHSVPSRHDCVQKGKKRKHLEKKKKGRQNNAVNDANAQSRQWQLKLKLFSTMEQYVKTVNCGTALEACIKSRLRQLVIEVLRSP